MPRYVILEHDHPSWHLDFMLEMPSALRTWRLHGTPSLGVKIRAEPIGDHRLAYLDYEGPVSGGRGSVKRWDAGDYELVSESPEIVVVDLKGMNLMGRAVIEKRGVFVFQGAVGNPGSND